MRQVVTVDGSWEIPDNFLVTWYNNEMRRIWDKKDVIILYYEITYNKKLEFTYFCEKIDFE